VHPVARRAGPRPLAGRAVWARGYDQPPPVPLGAATMFAPSVDVVVADLCSVDRGSVVAINAIRLDRVPAFSYGPLWWERQLRGVTNVTPADVAEFLALAAEIPLRSQTEVFPLAWANVALQRLTAGGISGAAVLTTG
jgi:propanol-preferring alcohol dehydrogenase